MFNDPEIDISLLLDIGFALFQVLPWNNKKSSDKKVAILILAPSRLLGPLETKTP